MKTYKFKARIEGASLGGACVYFPYNVEEEFGTRGRVPVKATFDGVPYSGSIVKYGAPLHMLGVLKSIREQIGKGPRGYGRSHDRKGRDGAHGRTPAGVPEAAQEGKAAAGV
jgi:hypothetical protein